MNPWNLKVTSNNSNSLVQVDSLRSVVNITLSYDGVVNKKFYLSMEFNKIDNSEFENSLYYPLSAMPSNKRLYTPQINNISMMMPPVPLLYQWDEVPKVIEFHNKIDYYLEISI